MNIFYELYLYSCKNVQHPVINGKREVHKKTPANQMDPPPRVNLLSDQVYPEKGHALRVWIMCKITCLLKINVL